VEGLFSFLLFAGLFYFMMRFGCGAHMVHGHGSHGEHAHGGDGAVGSAIDPVCGMSVAADQGYTKSHQGRQYRFCSRACLDKFEANPEQYLALKAGVR
jgi:YHS domain-containing protein